MRVDSGMSAIATTTGPFGFGVGWLVVLSPILPPPSNRMPTKATIARKIPTSRTRRFERLKVGYSPTSCVTGGTTLGRAPEPRDYTKGLGPLGRKKRKPRTL